MDEVSSLLPCKIPAILAPPILPPPLPPPTPPKREVPLCRNPNRVTNGDESMVVVVVTLPNNLLEAEEEGEDVMLLLLLLPLSFINLTVVTSVEVTLVLTLVLGTTVVVWVAADEPDDSVEMMGGTEEDN